ncbi:DUF5320 domain-containing protein [Candidatus Latescibacterota bacterium]
MPRGDKTGPNGMGPMTGRGAGYCAGFSAPGYMNPFGRQGQGISRGGGRGGRGYGRGLGFVAPDNPQTEDRSPDTSVDSSGKKLDMLKNQADQLESTLINLKNQIENLEDGK